MPVLGEPMTGALAGDRLSVKLPAEPDGKVADVDDLLDFAAALGQNLAGFPGDERRQFFFAVAKGVADPAHKLAAHRGWHIAPRLEVANGNVDCRFDLLGGRSWKFGQCAAINRRTRRELCPFSGRPLRSTGNRLRIDDTKSFQGL